MRTDEMVEDRQRWYVVRTLPHREASARTHLIAQDFCTFLPLEEKTIRHARRMTNVLRPVFPRYLFVRFDAHAASWRSINGTVGVDRLLMCGERPEPVRPGVVESLIASTDTDDRLHYCSRLEVGDRVRLRSGPLAEQLGVLQHLGPNDRVQVLLEFLGGPVLVQADRTNLVPAV